MHMCKHFRADHSSLNFVVEQENGAGAKSHVCVRSGKQSVNVTRSTGTDTDCSYMDNDSQLNMIVYVRKNNYMEGSGSATIK